MNKIILSGRLTKDPEVTTSQGGTRIARYTLAVPRVVKKEGEQDADFLNCICFGKCAEFVEKYLRKGMKVMISGRIQSSTYKNKDNKTCYSVNVVVAEHEFAESKKSGANNENVDQDGFMNIPEDQELPFS